MRIAAGLCAGALLVLLALGLMTHRALGTNAFDLSVFDYALWTTASGEGLAFVPMFRHSLFAQHFMPTLLLLSPLSLIFDSPVYLIVLQTILFAAAGLVLYRIAEPHVSRTLALALVAAFLLSRRSHAAVVSYFYIESAEPLLILGALLAWSRKHQLLYWALTLLALGCKEDVALYMLTFGAMIALSRRDVTTGLATMAVAGGWLAIALFVMIPHWRHLYDLPGSNPFLDGRYATADSAFSWGTIALRLIALESVARIITVASATGLLCFLSPIWIVPALPGIALNLAAAPGTAQAGLHGHYLWPILPWLFVAAIFGASRIPTPWRRWAPVVVVFVALVDMPLIRPSTWEAYRDWSASAQVRRQMSQLAPEGVVVAQPNLIPHLSRQMQVHALGVYTAGQPAGDYVLLSSVGDRWPLGAKGVEEEVVRRQGDPDYREIISGPLFAFERVARQPGPAPLESAQPLQPDRRRP